MINIINEKLKLDEPDDDQYDDEYIDPFQC